VVYALFPSDPGNTYRARLRLTGPGMGGSCNFARWTLLLDRYCFRRAYHYHTLSRYIDLLTPLAEPPVAFGSSPFLSHVRFRYATCRCVCSACCVPCRASSAPRNVYRAACRVHRSIVCCCTLTM